MQLFQPVANKSRERRHEGWVEADVWLWSSLRGTAGMKTRISTAAQNTSKPFVPKFVRCSVLSIVLPHVCVCPMSKVRIKWHGSYSIPNDSVAQP